MRIYTKNIYIYTILNLCTRSFKEHLLKEIGKQKEWKNTKLGKKGNPKEELVQEKTSGNNFVKKITMAKNQQVQKRKWARHIFSYWKLRLPLKTHCAPSIANVKCLIGLVTVRLQSRVLQSDFFFRVFKSLKNMKIPSAIGRPHQFPIQPGLREPGRKCESLFPQGFKSMQLCS